MEGGRRECYEVESEYLPCTAGGSALRKRRKSKNKRRFSDDQIRFLESMFEAETKPEPVKKVQLARELGLQPRQVAIWFQNKRARWKAKQIEQEYRVLSANYNTLKSQFESLEKDKLALVLQLKKLSSMLENTTHDESRDGKVQGVDCRDGGSDSGNEVQRGIVEGKLENGAINCLDAEVDNSDDDNKSMVRVGQFGYDNFPNNMEQQQQHMDGFSTSPEEEWCSLESGGGLFSDHPCNTSQWLHFWS